MVVVVGLPVVQGGRLFNAAAVLQAGRLLGVVPKTFLPGYDEYYEERWFSSARELRRGRAAALPASSVPFGTDLLFQLPDEPGVALAVEICEDLWAPIPPSSHHAVAGATVILNLSASNDTGRQGRVPPRAGLPAVGPHARRLRLRQRRASTSRRPTSSSAAT